MKNIKFNKTICGVDFLLNVLDWQSLKEQYTSEVKTTDFFQIIFIKKGNGTLLLNQNELEIQPNTILFISKHQKHQWNIDPNKFQAHFLVFQEDFLNDFFSDQYFTYRLFYFYQTTYPLLLPVKATILEDGIQNLLEIKQKLIETKNDSVHVIRSLLYYLLIKLNREYANFFGLKVSIPLTNHAYQFQKLLEEYIFTKQRIEDYTELMGISRISLNKAIKEQFNTTTTEFIKQKLLFEIKNKLIYTNDTISQIADTFNFSEPHHLTRLFKQKEGITPTEYRLSYQNGR